MRALRYTLLLLAAYSLYCVGWYVLLQSLVNESFLPHFTLFADTMREMGYVHYHNQQPVSAPANVAIGQPTDQSTATHMTPAVLIAADTAGTSNGTTGSQQQIEQQNGETAIVPG